MYPGIDRETIVEWSWDRFGRLLLIHTRACTYTTLVSFAVLGAPSTREQWEALLWEPGLHADGRKDLAILRRASAYNIPVLGILVLSAVQCLETLSGGIYSHLIAINRRSASELLYVEG